MRRILKIMTLVAVLAMPSFAFAASSDSMTNATLAKGATETGTYYAAGSNVNVNGNVNGDVLCAGQTVVINGPVKGDVICGAQNITINGDVTGSVRVVGQTVSINGTVGRNVTILAQSLTLGSGAKISGDMDVAGQSIDVGAPLAGDLYAAAQSMAIGALVSGNVNTRVTNLSLGNGATVAGNLTYTSNNMYEFSKTQVKGDVVRNLPPAKATARASLAAWVGVLVYGMLATLAATLLAIWLLPRFVSTFTDVMIKKPGSAVGWGFVGIIVGPVILIALLLTVIGAPLALFVGGLWLLSLFASSAAAAIALGRVVLGSKHTAPRDLALAALVGVPLVEIAIWLPWLGTLAGIGVAAWALGAVLISLNRARVRT